MIAWKILDIVADGDLIIHSKYHATLKEDDNIIETEGNWTFSDKILKIPFSEVTEEMVIDWIKNESMQDGQNIIEAQLIKQLDALKKQNVAVAPWMPQMFTPRI
jgi:hypothetical protein